MSIHMYSFILYINCNYIYDGYLYICLFFFFIIIWVPTNYHKAKITAADPVQLESSSKQLVVVGLEPLISF